MKFRRGTIRLLMLGGAVQFLIGCCGAPHKDVAATPPQATLPATQSEERTMGNPAAPITFIEYGAPTCPHCAHFDLDAMPRLKRDYIDKGKVYFVFRIFPLSPADGTVETLGRCLSADQYFPFLDLMFRNQSKWDPDGYQISDPRGAIVALAGTMGLSPAKADACLSDPQQQHRINRVAEDGFRNYNLDGVPTFIINGTVVLGYRGWLDLQARLDSLLAKP
jgi:protein-disulfide isomerase